MSASPQTLSDEILDLVAGQLASVRLHATLAALCSVSKDHYYLLRRHLYRHLLLNATSSRLLLQLREPPFAQACNAFPLSAFTSFGERAGLIEMITIAELPSPAVLAALQGELDSSTAPSAPPPSAPLRFRRLRTLVFLDISSQGWDTAAKQEIAENLMKWLGRYLHPQHVCLHYPDVAPEDYYADSSKLDFIGNPWIVSNILCGFAESRPNTAPPMTISLHNFWLSCPSPFYDVASIAAVNVYFRTPHTTTPANGNLQDQVATRLDRIEDLAVVLAANSDGQFPYHFHRVLNEAEADVVRNLPPDNSLVVGVVLSERNEEMAWDMWKSRLRKRYTNTFPDGIPRYENSPYRWSRFSKLVKERFDFCPEPEDGARCVHCDAAL